MTYEIFKETWNQKLSPNLILKHFLRERCTHKMKPIFVLRCALHCLLLHKIINLKFECFVTIANYKANNSFLTFISFIFKVLVFSVHFLEYFFSFRSCIALAININLLGLTSIKIERLISNNGYVNLWMIQTVPIMIRPSIMWLRSQLFQLFSQESKPILKCFEWIHCTCKKKFDK